MIKVRKAIDSDLDRIDNIFNKSTGRKLNKNVPRYLKTYPSVVAVRKETVVGFCYSRSFAPDILELMNIFLIESERGKGLGKMVIKAFENEAFKDFNSIILVNSKLYSSKENKRLATRFYLECGYKVVLSTPNSKIFGKDKSRSS